MTTAIDYLFDGYGVAFELKFISEYGHIQNYRSPFIFENIDDAYYAAINYL